MFRYFTFSFIAWYKKAKYLGHDLLREIFEIIASFWCENRNNRPRLSSRKYGTCNKFFKFEFYCGILSCKTLLSVYVNSAKLLYYYLASKGSQWEFLCNLLKCLAEKMWQELTVVINHTRPSEQKKQSRQNWSFRARQSSHSHVWMTMIASKSTHKQINSALIRLGVTDWTRTKRLKNLIIR